GGRLRVPGEAAGGDMAAQLGDGDLLDLARPGVPVGRGVRQHRARREDRRRVRVRRPRLGAGQPVRPARRPGHADAVHLPRRGVRRAEARRRHPGRCTAPRGPRGAGHPRPGAGLPAVDRGRRRPWPQVRSGDGTSLIALVVAVASLAAALVANRAGREGWSFMLSGVTIVAAVAMLFLTLFPHVMPSTLDPDWSLTVTNASSSPYTLKIMTWLAVVATPVVILYQGWTYWVFRKRIGTQHIADPVH